MKAFKKKTMHQIDKIRKKIETLLTDNGKKTVKIDLHYRPEQDFDGVYCGYKVVTSC